MMLPSGELIPDHFHVTEVGQVKKSFVDCGGVYRESTTCVLQVWTAHDFEHRLTSQKLVKILNSAKPLFDKEDLQVEIEYGVEVVSSYALSDMVPVKDGLTLVLDGRQTGCLAPDKCGVTCC